MKKARQGKARQGKTRRSAHWLSPSPLPPPLPPQKRWEPWMATGFVLCILLHHHHLAKVLLVAENLSHSDLNVSPQPPPCPLARPATTNASPRPERRLDNIVGQTQDTRKGPNGRKLDAPGRTDRQTDTTNDICCCCCADRDAANPLPGKYWLSEPTLRCVANRHKTNPIRTPHRKHRAGERDQL